jgi:predicted neuraminidase
MESHFIYNPDGVGSHCHCATLCEHQGEVYVTWYGYVEKENEKAQIAIAKYSKASGKWNKGYLPFSHLGSAHCGNPVLFSDPVDKKLHLYFVILKHHYWDSAQIYHSVFEEEKNEWTMPNMLDLPLGMMIRHRPIFMDNDTVMIPAYHEKENTSYLYSSQRPFTNWSKVGEVDGDLIQGDLINTDGAEWQLYLRPSMDTPHYIFRALSPDNGRSWNTVLRMNLPCPLSGVAVAHFGDKKVVIAHNNTEEFKRNPISLSVSDNYGMSFLKQFDVESSEGMELSYPNMLVDSERKLHMVYTFNRRMIKHVCWDESEIFDGHG